VYKIEMRDFGYRLTFGDLMSAMEMRRWVEESLEVLPREPRDFHVFVDMRTLAPLDEECQAIIRDGQRLYKQRGMVRSVVILSSPVITVQFKRIALQSGIYEWERYVDAAANDNWEQLGMGWLRDAVDPDYAIATDRIDTKSHERS
jgi:hypothetical protein